MFRKEYYSEVAPWLKKREREMIYLEMFLNA